MIKNLKEWLYNKREIRVEWNHLKKWWEPAIYLEDDNFYGDKELDWLCDNLGDAQETMEKMWE